jgi:hypothetical protein
MSEKFIYTIYNIHFAIFIFNRGFKAWLLDISPCRVGVVGVLTDI